VTVSVKVRKDVLELIDKMVRYGLARSRSHAINILIERGLKEIRSEIEFWEKVYRDVEEFEKQGYVVRHGLLNKVLEEDRGR